MNKFLIVFLLTVGSLWAQTADNNSVSEKSPDYSGMYSFLQEGEFLQLTVEDNGVVSGFVSRYGDGEGTDRPFVDHFFKSGRLAGKKLFFTTETAHNRSYEFKGTIDRGEGKKLDDEGYFVIKGALTENKIDANKKTTSRNESVVFKSFPQDLGDAPK